jgi:adenosylcobinamide-phosphate synthase
MNYFLYSLIALCVGFALDLLLGDPQGFPHIIRFMGFIISRFEKLLRRLLPKTSGGELTGGILLVLSVIVICAGLPTLLLVSVYRLSIYAGIAFESLICYQMLAARSLRDESMLVYRHLKDGNLPSARRAVSMIVGRDTDCLDSAGVTRAAVETISENTADGVIAPLFFLAIGGAPLGLLFKAVPTMDSMVGYKNDRYLYFGRPAARLDDVLNFIPARITALLMLLSCLPARFDFRRALRVYIRDKHNHKSPNSAHSEAVCAGALGIQLGGDAYYSGKLQKKPTIGDDLKTPESEDIKDANRMMLLASVAAFFLFALAKILIIIILRGI